VSLSIRVRGIPDERYAFIDLDDFGIQWWRTADVEVENPRTGLISYK
jgi:hypothetical protein